MDRNTKNMTTYRGNAVAYTFSRCFSLLKKEAKEKTSFVASRCDTVLDSIQKCPAASSGSCEPLGSAEDPVAYGVCTFPRGLRNTYYLECINNVPGIFQYLWYLPHYPRWYELSAGQADFLLWVPVSFLWKACGF